jgi:hypothetical protein
MLTILAACLAINRQEITQQQLTIRALDACDAGPYSPLLTIRAINDVVSLNPQQSRRLLDQYFKKLGLNGKGNLYPLIRCIFDIPRQPGYLPLPKLGQWNPMPPASLKTSPRFPIALVGDIPFFISSATGALGGFPEPEAKHYIYLSTMATLRTKRLVPVDRPWALLPRSNLPDNVNFGPDRAGMNHDILSLVSTAYQPKNYVDGKPSRYTDNPAGWRYVVNEMERVHVHWDRSREMYVRADGSTLK